MEGIVIHYYTGPRVMQENFNELTVMLDLRDLEHGIEMFISIFQFLTENFRNYLIGLHILLPVTYGETEKANVTYQSSFIVGIGSFKRQETF